MPRWEYLYLDWNGVMEEAGARPIDSAFNILGEKEWELVGFSHMGTSAKFIFKRMK